MGRHYANGGVPCQAVFNPGRVKGPGGWSMQGGLGRGYGEWVMVDGRRVMADALKWRYLLTK